MVRMVVVFNHNESMLDKLLELMSVSGLALAQYRISLVD